MDFPNNLFGRKKRHIALEKAHDLRKFEIELYWKRATYFWTFLAATFASYFLITSNSEKITHSNLYLLVVSSIGVVFSLGWYLVNRGSKRWQENWEIIVAKLEDTITGPLTKIISNKEYRWYKVQDAFRYSASSINQLISLYILAIWILIFVLTIINGTLSFVTNSHNIYQTGDIGLLSIYLKHAVLIGVIYLIIITLTIVFVFLLIDKGKSGIQHMPCQGGFVNYYDT